MGQRNCTRSSTWAAAGAGSTSGSPPPISSPCSRPPSPTSRT